MIEQLRPGVSAKNARVVLFDFDGTISLIRSGWVDVMVPMMLEIMLDLKSGESEAELRAADWRDQQPRGTQKRLAGSVRSRCDTWHRLLACVGRMCFRGLASGSVEQGLDCTNSPDEGFGGTHSPLEGKQ